MTLERRTSSRSSLAVLVIGIIVISGEVVFLGLVVSGNIAANNPTAISMSALLNGTSLGRGQDIRVTVAVQNNLFVANQVSLSGDWRIQNLTMGPCSYYSYSPFGIAVYQGRYTADNISSGKQMEIYAPGFYSCGIAIATDSFRLGPLQKVSGYVDLAGFWTEGWTVQPSGGVSEGVLNPFLPGVYTVAVGDEWGQLQLLYFEVRGIALQGFSLCAANCGYPSPYLSGYIYIDGSTPLKSLELVVNGTAQGAQAYGGSNLTAFAIWWKGGFSNPPAVKGDDYNLTFMATFQDGSKASASTDVKAS
jgi:hypothetical protein